MSAESASFKTEEAAAKTEAANKPQETTNSKAQETANRPAAVEKRSFLRRLLVPVLILLLAAAILFTISYNWNSMVGAQKDQKTDDAYLRSDITPLSTRISGTVSQV